MPSALAATTIGSPEASRVMRSASARADAQCTFERAAEFAGIVLQGRGFQAENDVARNRRPALLCSGHGVEIGQDQAALIGAGGKEQFGEVGLGLGLGLGLAWPHRLGGRNGAAQAAQNGRRRSRIGCEP